MSEAALAETPVEAYLALEATGCEHGIRHEYWDGAIRAMGGASLVHNRVVLAIGAELRARTKGGPCEAFVNDMRVRLNAHRYVYPDVVLACPPEVDDAQRPESLINPRVVFEVLSESTAAFDRGHKLDGYRAMPTLTDYVLVDSTAQTFDHYARRDDGSWVVRKLEVKDTLRLEGIDLELPVRAVLGA